MVSECLRCVQARPAEAHHDKMAYFGTTGRKLQQGPPGTVPEGVNETEADAAMTPMAAPGQFLSLRFKPAVPVTTAETCSAL